MQSASLVYWVVGAEACFNTVNGIRVHAMWEEVIAVANTRLGFNTVNGIRVHAILNRINCCRFLGNQSFNTVNGIRVHAISESLKVTKAEAGKFQYRKRYKGACN